MVTEGKISLVKSISRRELLSYAWGTTAALLGAEIGGIVLVFSMPPLQGG
jgi:hypothetical protein